MTAGLGDLLVTVEVVVPTKLSAEARKALEEFADQTPPRRAGNIDERVRRYELTGQPRATEVSGDVRGVRRRSGDPADEAKVLIISVAARMAGMHPQTLRQYDRMGLVQPGRATGGGRRYSVRDVALLREVQRLSQDDGVNLAGVKRIIELERLLEQAQQRLARLEAELDAAYRRIAELEALATFPGRDLVPTNRTSTALVVWRPRRNPER